MPGSKRRAPGGTPPDPGPDASPRREPTIGAGRPIGPGLYLVATPIGDLDDITLRALHILHQADVVACEDTRVAAILLRRHGIATPTTAYHEHNAAKVRPRLLERMAEGARVALISDAGTPLISDPGYRLAAEARAAGIAVTAAPGASAVLAALSLSGLPTDAFTFAGFLPPKPGPRGRALERLAAAPGSLVLFEAARRLPALLADCAARLGAREAAVCRELTKLHEEVRRGPLPELAAHYAETGPPRGEVVVVIAPAAEGSGAAAVDDAAIDAALDSALATMSVRDAADAVAASLAQPRRRVYGRALQRAKVLAEPGRARSGGAR